MFRPSISIALTIAAFAADADSIVRLTDSSGNAVPDAVVYLENLSGMPAAEDPLGAVIDQRNEQFVPQITVVQAGAAIAFPNSDEVGHHVYSFAQPNSFELPLYKGEIRPEIRFRHPGIVTLGCNIHDSMLGYVLVVDTPYFGVSDADGRVELGDLPPGSYAVSAWTLAANPLEPERLGQVEVAGGSQEFALRVKTRGLATGTTHGTALSWDEY